ncbi:WXG100 family type VII secretion target [Paenibacillus polysaccharolyticus]|uniref:WXG100 family type VII secretion target n=1 Tax=Paenibacillus polysaccharolyticus TaxID=582692 RepID=UPI002040B166|nr:WXG100 family type VII secretion target [Paenibacillus polysaccharolyticus]MCM3134080.1 WXG100 family type VII secretion target [Paenibacillus polysaccharolyticus]
MSTIKVTPEQLLHVSKQIEQGRRQLESIRSDLSARIGYIESQWEGATQERFFYDFQQSRPVLDRALESMVKSSQDLKAIAVRFQQADQEQVSVGAVAGSIALQKLVSDSNHNPDTPEYTMVYNTQFRKMMPTDKDGNVIPETLRAYERDTGSLDMKSAPDVGPEGEDIMQYQVDELKNGVYPFSGEPVSENRARLLITSLQASNMLMAFAGMYNRGYKVPKSGLKLSKDIAAKPGHVPNKTLHDNPILSKTNKGLEVQYTNHAGNRIVWIEQNPKNIPHAIDAAKNSRDTGKVVEGKVGEFVESHVGVTGFGVEVKNVDNKLRVTDLDVVTNSQIIEVKKSAGAVKIDQIDRLVDINHKEFFNHNKKEVVLYIDAPLENTGPIASGKIDYAKSKGVKVVNSLDELREVLK